MHGLLQRVLPVFAPGESGEVEVGITVLGRGRWVVGGLVEEVRILENDGEGEVEGGEEDFVLDAGRKERERRVWGVEEGCVVVCE